MQTVVKIPIILFIFFRKTFFFEGVTKKITDQTAPFVISTCSLQCELAVDHVTPLTNEKRGPRDYIDQ